MINKLWFKANPPKVDARPSKRWFRAKRYGWGWTPCSWEGWLVTIIAIGFIIWNSLQFDPSVNPFTDVYIIKIILTMSILLSICYIKGEKPKWRWGRD